MRGIKIIINGQPTYLPYNKKTIAFYEERNNLLRGKAAEQEEVATILDMSEEEVNTYLYAPTAPSTPGIIPQSGIDFNKLMELLITQQTEIAELKKQFSTTNPIPANAAVETPLKSSKKITSAPIKLDKEIEKVDIIPTDLIKDELQDFT